MKKEFTLILSIFILLNINTLRGQNIFKNLNNLPTTIEVKAPEFNTVTKYFIKIDKTKKTLFIQDVRKSKNGKIHFYQWLYEIPLSRLGSDSFRVSKDADNKLRILIKTADKSNSILYYMFQDSKVSSIMAVNVIGLGKWPYSKSLFDKLSKIINSISNSLPKKPAVLTSNKSQSKQVYFKYIANNVIRHNALLNKDLSFWDGYYFSQIINKKGMNLYPQIIRRIKSALKKQNINYKYPTPIIIYTDKKGAVESIFIVNKPTDKYCKIDIRKVKPLKAKNNPTKYLFLLK